MDSATPNKLTWGILILLATIFMALLFMRLTTPEIPPTDFNPPEQSSTITNSGFSTTSTEIIQNIASSTPDTQTYSNALMITGANNSYNVTGSDSALVTIVEFGDFTCIHCRASYPVIRSISVKYQDRVKFIFRDRTPSQRSIGLALTAHCAGEQGKFWQMHDLLYQNQSDTLGEATDDPNLLGLAGRINLDQAKFNKCLDERRYLAKIKQNTQDSEKLGVLGTPTWFINGEKFEGELNQVNVENYLDRLLESLTIK